MQSKLHGHFGTPVALTPRKVTDPLTVGQILAAQNGGVD